MHMLAEVFTYLDVKQRVAVLNTRAEVVRELFEMLRDELKHQQANKLEIIVIWLIVADGMCFVCMGTLVYALMDMVFLYLLFFFFSFLQCFWR